MNLNINQIKELIIIIMGPIFQILAYYLLILFFNQNLVLTYHLNILIFNLIPIYPLDGGKILNIILSSYLPYKKSLKLSIYLSYIFLVIFFIKTDILKMNIIMTIIFLIILIKKEDNKIEYKYNKFKLERYLNNYNFKKSKIIKNINDLYKNKRHLIKIEDKYYLEREYFEKKYKKS